MSVIATLGPEGSHAWQAARQYSPDAEIRLYTQIQSAVDAFIAGEAAFAVIPVYNTREGEIKEYFHIMENLSSGYWIDNSVLPIHLSLGTPADTGEIRMLAGTGHALRQCEGYLAEHFPGASLITSQDLPLLIKDFKGRDDFAVIEAEPFLKANGLTIREREVAPYNRTRYAVLGKNIAESTGYDATALITAPLKDRVGLLFDILGEFTRRGVNLLDMRTETDIKSQKLQFYFEAEGHINDKAVREALDHIENNIVQEKRSIRVLGSFPRVDMRVKRIKTIGFIGTGGMSQWFARRLENEGYNTILTGRSTPTRPEDMLRDAEVVAVCVPISATPETIRQYGPMLRDGQALILFAGEAESSINTAIEHTSQGVEIMLIHNLWGPKASNMKDKNVSVVRTSRSGALCSEVESFLYKHGAEISHDSPVRHDLLMGAGQKLPTAASLALAMTFKSNSLSTAEIESHSTLTSLYGLLAMARVHSQNPRTYAEILSAQGAGGKILRDFAAHLNKVLDLADKGDIESICSLIDQGREYFPEEFLESMMRQALAVDETLGKPFRS